MPNTTIVAAAYNYCEKFLKKDTNKWPLEVMLLSKAEKKHLYALWAFLRTIDNFTDEGELTNEQRLALLDNCSKKIADCYQDKASEPIYIALQDMVQQFSIPEHLFQKLVAGFKQDLVKTRYQTFDELLDYCDKVANPLGRIFLNIHSYQDEKLFLLSDDFITAMQLTDFWLDVYIDINKDRVYIPLEDLNRFNCTENEIALQKQTENFKSLMAYEIERTENIFSRSESIFSQLSKKHELFGRIIFNNGIGRLQLIKNNNYDINAQNKISVLDKLQWIMKGCLRSIIG